MKSSSLNWQPVVLSFVAIIALALLTSSFVIVNPGQAGVLSVLGKAQDGALLEGIHFKTAPGIGGGYLRCDGAEV